MCDLNLDFDAHSPVTSVDTDDFQRKWEQWVKENKEEMSTDYGFGFTNKLEDYLLSLRYESKRWPFRKIYSCQLMEQLHKNMIDKNIMIRDHLKNLHVVVTPRASRYDDGETRKDDKEVMMVCHAHPHPNVQRLYHEFTVSSENNNTFNNIPYGINCEFYNSIVLPIIEIVDENDKPFFERINLNTLLSIMIDVTSGLYNLHSNEIYHISEFPFSVHHLCIRVFQDQLNIINDTGDDDVFQAVVCSPNKIGLELVHDVDEVKILKKSAISGILSILLLLSGRLIKLFDNDSCNYQTSNNVKYRVVDTLALTYDSLPVENMVKRDCTNEKSTLMKLKTSYPQLYEIFHNVCLNRSLNKPEYTVKNLHNRFATLYTRLKHNQLHPVLSTHTPLLPVLCDMIIYYCCSRYNIKL